MDHLHHSKRLPTANTDGDSINALWDVWEARYHFLQKSLYNVHPAHTTRIAAEKS